MSIDEVSFGIFLPSYTRGTSFELLLKITRLSEERGLDSVWICDHLLGVDSVVGDRRPDTPEVFESTITLAALARETRRVRLGTAVTSIPYRNPALYAKQIAMLDVLSNGRIDVGFGTGWRKREFDAYGIPFEPIQTRIERTKEGIELMKRLLSEASVTFRGKYYEVTDCQIRPGPVQKPHPPFWLGATGPRVMSSLLPLADGWLPPAVSIDLIRERRAILESVEKKRGRRLRIGIEFYTTVAKNREAAVEKADPYVEEWFGYTLEGIERLFRDSAEMRIELESTPFRAIGRPAMAVGSPEDCVEIIERYVKEGVSLYVLHFMPPNDSYDQLRTYLDKVIPYFKEGGS